MVIGNKNILSLLLFAGGFLLLVGSFGSVDIYHQHFFAQGPAIFIYNLSRVVFAFYLIWIIYAVGFGIINFFASPASLENLTLFERIVFSFGTGIGFWHVFLLLLGIFNLYYQSIMIGLCFVVLCISAKHFKQVLQEIFHLTTQWRQNRLLYSGYLLFGIALGWLLITKGLYPGGGGDYYNHYFKYYLAVIHNHGLAPNDVWYHYYYTKGSGLDFLAILLMDPQAPEVVTFCYVTIAALALMTFSARLIPKSLWPVFCGITYVLYYIVSVSGSGGEFQKLHEKSSALIIMAVWTICMYASLPKARGPALITLISLMLGLSVLMQPGALLFVAFFAAMTIAMALTKNFKWMKTSLLLCSITGTAVASIFLLNYLVTGLATDQLLDLSWRFANIERLNQWGIIPNILMGGWERHQYALMTEPYGWSTIQQLITFMRLDRLWIVVVSGILALLLYAIRKNKSVNQTNQPVARPALIALALLISVFSVFSLFFGHVQSVSYLRFSSFFFPIVILFSIACWALYITELQWGSNSLVINKIIPTVLLVAVFSLWGKWFADAREISASAMRFMLGKYSLADAYTHQHGDIWFGAINPAVMKAARQIPPDTRIWSMNGNSHCSVPGCRIESIYSFKLSSKLNEILNGKPEQAKEILQSEGLNYFLYASDYDLLDLLAYSHLFNPMTLNKYFTIKWTDGKTYLLTWRGQNGSNISPQFIKTFAASLDKPRTGWFSFRQALPDMDQFMKQIASSSRPVPFPPLPTESNSHAQ